MSLIIADSEFRQSVQTLVNRADQIRQIGDRYRVCIGQLGASAMDSASIQAALGDHMAQVDNALTALFNALEPLSGKTGTFIEDIDEIDTFIY